MTTYKRIKSPRNPSNGVYTKPPATGLRSAPSEARPISWSEFGTTPTLLPQLFSGEVRSAYIDANKGVNSCDQKLHQSPLIGSSTTLPQSCACLISSIYLSSLFIIVYIVASSVFTHRSCVHLICFYLISILFLTHGMLSVYYI